MPGPDPRKVKLDEDKRGKNYPSKRGKEKGVKENILDNIDLEKIEVKPGEIYIITDGPEFNAKGGRVGLRGGGICKKGMNRKAVGKNS